MYMVGRWRRNYDIPMYISVLPLSLCAAHVSMPTASLVRTKYPWLFMVKLLVVQSPR
ncbi:hypothetical protein BDN67DRAFT_973422 [Paxillus ammoniavirescens]|nr:hypothetical protein BDN67DRAFT_973422 [Paxillus ammoniavirescens]